VYLWPADDAVEEAGSWDDPAEIRATADEAAAVSPIPLPPLVGVAADRPAAGVTPAWPAPADDLLGGIEVG
jgi:hypothetical protein